MGFFSRFRGPKIRLEQSTLQDCGWVRIDGVPSEPEWTFEEADPRGEGFTIRQVALRRADTPNFALMATDYAGSVDETIGELRRRDWRAHCLKVFAQLDDVETTDGMQALVDEFVPALDVMALGIVDTHAAHAESPYRAGPLVGAPFKLHERYAYVPGHRLVVSFVGSQTSYATLRGYVDAWFQSVAFNPR